MNYHYGVSGVSSRCGCIKAGNYARSGSNLLKGTKLAVDNKFVVRKISHELCLIKRSTIPETFGAWLRGQYLAELSYGLQRCLISFRLGSQVRHTINQRNGIIYCALKGFRILFPVRKPSLPKFYPCPFSHPRVLRMIFLSHSPIWSSVVIFLRFCHFLHCLVLLNTTVCHTGMAEDHLSGCRWLAQSCWKWNPLWSLLINGTIKRARGQNSVL